MEFHDFIEMEPPPFVLIFKGFEAAQAGRPRESKISINFMEITDFDKIQ